MQNNLLENNLDENNYNDDHDNHYTYSYICLGFFIFFLSYYIIVDIII